MRPFILFSILLIAVIFYFLNEAATDNGRELKEQMDYTLRGIRNKNPMNIEHLPGQTWLGEIGTDGRFPKFSFHWQGIRAGMVNYLQDYYVDGIHTLEGLGEDNTPASDNPGSTVGQYGHGLGKKMGIASDVFFDMKTYRYDLAKAVIKLELGFNPYFESTLKKGVDAAWVHAKSKGWVS